jgi:hypothetical protein
MLKGEQTPTWRICPAQIIPIYCFWSYRLTLITGERVVQC